MSVPPVKNDRAAEYAERLREALAHADLRARDLARLVNVSDAAVSRWLAGTREIGQDHQIAVARALGYPTSILFPRMTEDGVRIEW